MRIRIGWNVERTSERNHFHWQPKIASHCHKSKSYYYSNLLQILGCASTSTRINLGKFIIHWCVDEIVRCVNWKGRKEKTYTLILPLKSCIDSKINSNKFAICAPNIQMNANCISIDTNEPDDGCILIYFGSHSILTGRLNAIVCSISFPLQVSSQFGKLLSVLLSTGERDVYAPALNPIRVHLHLANKSGKNEIYVRRHFQHLLFAQ